MTHNNNTNLWAYLLIGLGLLFLATDLGWFGFLTGWLWALLFVAGGTTFLYLYRENPRHWWALIPGFALVALGVAALSGDAAGGLFLGLVGAGFAAVYATNRARWWAIIPAGALFTLALIAWLGAAFPLWDAGWLFFLGLTATFGALYLLPPHRHAWALYPAFGGVVLVGITLVSSPVGEVLLPLLLVLAGIYLAWRQGKPSQDTIRSPARSPKRKGA